MTERLHIDDPLTDDASENRLPKLFVTPTAAYDGAFALDAPTPLDHKADLALCVAWQAVATRRGHQQAELDNKGRPVASPNMRNRQAMSRSSEMIYPIFHKLMMIET